uniref:NARG2_C domain-containing protein n=1 Tax=Trichuris muris TaxID=70415 RepID=A0A5S6Q466_TRIMR
MIYFLVRNAQAQRKKRRLGAADHLGKMMGDLAGYQNVSIGIKKSKPGLQSMEDATRYHQPEQPDRQRCYDLWTIKEFALLIRSNSDGFLKHRDATGIGRNFKVSLMPKIEFQPEHGGEVLRAEELRTYYWNLFLKRAKLHVIVRVHHLLEQALCVETISPTDLLSKDIYTSRHQWVSDGFSRLHWILSQLTKLDDGFYLLSRVPSVLNCFSLYSEATDLESPDVHLLEESRKRVYINVLNPECAWLRIDPSVILQWHIIRKHAPAAFDPRETSRGITPLVSLEGKMSGGGKFGKRKGKKGRACMARQVGNDNQFEQDVVAQVGMEDSMDAVSDE